MDLKQDKLLNRVLEEAAYEASSLCITEITESIMLIVMHNEVKYSQIAKALSENKFNFFEFSRLVEKRLTTPVIKKNIEAKDVVYPNKEKFLKDLEELMMVTNSTILTKHHLLLALFNSDDEIVNEYVKTHNIPLATIKKDCIECILTGHISRYSYNEDKNESEEFKEFKLPEIASETCEDYTALAENGELDPIIGRDSEIDIIINTMARRTKNNILLVGPSGVGKTAIVKGLALKLFDNQIPALKNKRILSLNVGALMSNSKYRGELEKRVNSLVKELMEMENVILFIDEMHVLLGAGGSSDSKLDISNLLKPALTNRKLQIIGCTTLKELRVIQEDAAFLRRFNQITLEEPNEKDTIHILNSIKHKYEEYHHVSIPEETIKAAVTLSGRYITERFNPDKSIDVIDEAAAKLKLSTTTNINEEEITELAEAIKEEMRKLEEDDLTVEEYVQAYELIRTLKLRYKELKRTTHKSFNNPLPTPVLTPDYIANVIESRTHIPVSKLVQSDKEKLLHLEEELHKQIIGQDTAVQAVANAIRRNGSGISNHNKPIASFLFLGPSGTGKTELCKVLADLQFGSRDNMIKIDCSEFSESHSISKLIGSPAGYIGSKDGGNLTEAVRHQPYSVVLFDEIEKAHKNFTDILLQVLDEGRLTDAQGVTVSFKNCVIVLTSNLGSGLVTESRPIGFGSTDIEDVEKSEYESFKDKTMDTVKKTLRPELINRLDEIVVFHGLNKEHLRQITRLLGKELDKRLLELGIVVTCSDAALDFVTDHGYNPEYGARPLARAIMKLIEEPLSIYLLEDKIVANDTIQVDLENDKLVFFKEVNGQIIKID